MKLNKYQRGNAKVVVAIVIGILVIAGIFYWQSQNGQKSGTMDPIVKDNAVENVSTKVLAQKNSSFVEFNQRDYEKALSEGKIVYLEFYANWCPICRAQEPDLIEGFNKLSRADVVGFRVNFKDDQTDESEIALAEKYKIPYQHHKIVLKNKDVVIDSAESWDAQTLVSELSKL